MKIAVPPKEKEMTIDALANIIEHGFESVDKRFEEIADRVTGIEDCVDSMEKMLFDDEYEHIARLEDRIMKLEADFRALLDGKR